MNIITFDDQKYPVLLKKIGRDAPKQLYFKGSWDSEIFENCLAVVGSRHMTTYGKHVVEKIVTPLSGAGVTIVSGFMYGVDAEAHKTALRVGGRTIAVMPCGIDLIHPEHQQDLYVEILNNNGLVISEYEGNMAPVLWSYPRRNRIVAGLSQATLVIEAGEKSGSLITANLAKKFKRKVFVVPGPITSENSKGIMQLIKEGAEAVNSAQDILKYYRIKSQIPMTNVQSNLSLRDISRRETKSQFEQKILEYLQREALEIDALARITETSASEIGTILSLMQLSGQIKHEGGKYYLV